MQPVITLATDFGLDDCFVAAMKGVIITLAPDARIVDVCHQIPARDILAGALMLEEASACFPAGTIHVAVIDPGVGGSRRTLALETETGFFVGPDNGVFSLLSNVRRCVQLENPRLMRPKVSRTFHGRDIFAPAAAYLARGVPLKEFGREVEPASLVRLPLSEPDFKPGRVEAHVLRADHFGNLVCDLKEDAWAEWLRSQSRDTVEVRLNRTAFGPLRETFAEVGEGRPVAYFGSSGRLELALRNDNLARQSRTRRGARVLLNLKDVKAAKMKKAV